MKVAFSRDVFPPDDRCEICGAELADEVVIQEFADGSLARLCVECAAGTALDPKDRSPADGLWPSHPESTSAGNPDPMEMTKELLTPVVDLITLQREMQGALERLASSLERFADGVLTESLDKTTEVEDRVFALERELEETRTRLREAESRLTASATSAGHRESEAALVELLPEPGVEEAPRDVVTPLTPAPLTAAPVAEPSVPPQTSTVDQLPAAAPAGPVAAESSAASGGSETPHTFRLEEVQVAQRYFNDSQFIARIRDVRHSLGKPQANLSRAGGGDLRALVTIAWDIVWYQYLVDLRRDIPSEERVILYREGMDLNELPEPFREKNASIDDEGRLDASELEVRLLSDPSALITEMSADEERALEDATEEIWDQRISPEFKWDA